MTLPRVFRWIAIAIAVLAVVDPAITSTRSTRPEVALIAVDSTRDAAVIARVARELGDRFTVIPGPFAPAAATVIVGRQMSPSAAEVASNAFAVLPERARPGVSIESVNAPARAALDARVPVSVGTHVAGGNGMELETTLHLGDVVIDRVTQRIESDDVRSIVSLSFVPTATGAAPLRVSARMRPSARQGAASTAAADLVVDVRDDRWAVLFFDPRPSWLSTFVRRAVERDPRFVVTSRVVTSRNVSIDAGRPPATLGDARSLAAFDAIVVGAAQALEARDVAGLETFLRERGGTVVFLLDERASGAYDRLTGVGSWSGTSSAAGSSVSSVRGDSAALRATAVAWPSVLPSTATTLATVNAPSGSGARAGPVVWRTAVGAGQLIVSGALDAWRFRDPAQSRFEHFWRSVVADAAATGARSLEVVVEPEIAPPGERVEITATMRTLTLATDAATDDSVTATLEAPNGPQLVRMHRDVRTGRFRGTVRAPVAVGHYRLGVTSPERREDVPITVAVAPTRPTPDESELLAAWSASRSGRVFEERELSQLGPALEEALRPSARTERWYPMRSAWWILPFALLLGAEWLSQRRRGLA